MIHTIKIDDSLPIGKKLVNDLRRYKTAVSFETPSVNEMPPKGYVTGDEFEQKVKEKVTKYYKENGLL